MARDTREAPTAPYWVRFKVETSVSAPAHEYSRRFGRGSIADLSDEIWPGGYLIDQVRPDTYDRIPAETAAPEVSELEGGSASDSEE